MPHTKSQTSADKGKIDLFGHRIMFRFSAEIQNFKWKSLKAIEAPVAQLDRVLPSEGRGHRFESCRVRQPFQ